MNEFDKINDLPEEDLDDLLLSIKRCTEEPEEPPNWAAFAPSEEVLDWATPEQEPQSDQPMPTIALPPKKERFQLDKTPDEFWNEDDGLPSFVPESIKKPIKRAGAEAKPARKAGPAASAKTPKPRRRKRKSLVWRIARTALIVLLVLFLSIGTVAFFAAGRMNIEPLDAEHRAIVRRPSSRPWVTTILLLGIDEPIPHGRADTMMLVTIDHRTQSLRLTSILRDSWVRFPDGSSRKINEVTVGRGGGGPQAMRVIAENFGIRVDHYVLLNFNAFEAIIDAMGGIAVPMTQREINFLANTTRLGRQIGRAEMERQMAQNSVVHLTGEQALIFARIRRLDNDVERGRRNRLVMDAMLSRVRANPLRLIPVMNSGLPGIYTSMSQLNTAVISLGLPLYALYSIVDNQLPAPGTFRGETRDTFRYVIDFEANRRIIREFIYG